MEDEKLPLELLDYRKRHENFFKELEIEFLIHELKDPIYIIETGIQTVLEHQDRFGPLTTRQQKTIKRVHRNAKKAREMLYGLLEVGRSESNSFICSNFQPTKAGYEVLVDCLEIRSPNISDRLRQIKPGKEALEYLKTCGIHFNAPPDIERLKIYQDKIKFRQIAGNLIKNALHFRSKMLEIKWNVENDLLVLDVIDDGPGIPEQQHETIFRRYSQIKESPKSTRSGHGLGLAGARIMARCLGGELNLTSGQNTDTTFRLTLPLQFEKLT